MDTQVIYIMLLLVITVICIGISAGVKYDKNYTTGENLPYGHDYADEEQIQILNTLSEEEAKLSALITSQAPLKKDFMSLNDEINNVTPVLVDGTITLEKKKPTLEDINKLFISESINDLSGTQYHYNLYSTFLTDVTQNAGQTGSQLKIQYDSDTATYQIFNNVNNAQQIVYQFNKDDVKFPSYIPSNFSEAYTFQNGTQTYASFLNDSPNVDVTLYTDKFSFDQNGFLMVKQKYVVIFSDMPLNNNYFVLTDSIEYTMENAPTSFLLKIYENGLGIAGYEYSLSAVKLLKTPLTTQLYNLEYFGLTTNTNLPPPISPQNYISKSSPFTLTSIRQIPKSFTNTLGIFATISTVNPPDSITVANFTGLDANITSDNYAINVVNTTTPIPDNYIIPVYSTTVSYAIPTSGKIFYSINLLVFDNVDLSNAFTIVDKNTVKGVQNIVIVCSPRQFGQPSLGNYGGTYYNILERGVRNFITTPTDTIDSTFIQKQLYNKFSGYNMAAMIVFPLVYEHSVPSPSIDISKYYQVRSVDPKPINYTSFNSGSSFEQYSYVWNNTTKTYTEYVLNNKNGNTWALST